MKKSIYIYQFITVILFLVLIGLPLFQDITHVFSLHKLKGENKAIAKIPSIDIKHLNLFPSQFTSFYNDNFPFRALFFQFDYRLFFKKSPVKAVLFGREKWLFFEKNGNVYQGLTIFPEEKMDAIIQKLDQRMKIYDEMGIKFYVAVVPASYEIYPEYLPRYIMRVKETVTDKFCKLIQANTDIPFIYLKEELLKNKTAGQLYRKNDHHWNEFGAYFAYKAIIDIIKKDFPEIPTYSLSDFELTPNYTKGGDLIDMLDDRFKTLFDEDITYQVKLKDSCKSWYKVEKVGYPCVKGFPYPWEYEWVGETSMKELPNILIIRDSYFNTMAPFFFNSFSRSVAIFDAWLYGENMDIVLQENPKIVLLIMAEGNIANMN
jgi:hypothetical protein